MLFRTISRKRSKRSLMLYSSFRGCTGKQKKKKEEGKETVRKAIGRASSYAAAGRSFRGFSSYGSVSWGVLFRISFQSGNAIKIIVEKEKWNGRKSAQSAE